MALRVLLADESNTIKKVFQLSLQEYAADIRPVHLGIDVVQVAQQFKPHIIFVDVLLQKLNGYDVCAQIKNHEELKDTPVILMWSQFMEFDQDKYEASGADYRLEKPFEVEQMKQIIQKYVPKTKAQKLSRFLTLPDLPHMESESRPAASPNDIPIKPVEKPASPSLEPPPVPTGTSSWGMDSFDPIPEYSEKLTPEKVELPDLNLEDSEEEFERRPLSQRARPQSPQSFEEITLDPSENSDEADLFLDDDDPDEEWENQSLYHRKKSKNTKETFDSEPDLQVEELPPSDFYSAKKENDSWGGFERRRAPALNEQQILKVIQEQYKEEIRKMVKEMLPEIAKEIIQKELNEILSEMEGSS